MPRVQIRDLENTLSQLGGKGTKFVERLDTAPSIPADHEEHPTLQLMNQLAKLVPSDPYSAIVMRGNTLYIAQNKDNSNGVTEEALSLAIRNSDTFRALTAINPIANIQIERYDRANGEHPDTVAMQTAIMSDRDNNVAKATPTYLGLAALNSQAPASCSGCGAVIKALNDNGYAFHVSSFTPTNFPSNRNYRIPNIITADSQLFDSYLDHVRKSVDSLDQKIRSSSNEDLYIQYATRDAIKAIMQNDEDRADIKAIRDQARTEYHTRPADKVDSINLFDETLREFKADIKTAQAQIPALYSEEKIALLRQVGRDLDGYDEWAAQQLAVPPVRPLPGGVRENHARMTTELARLREEVKENTVFLNTSQREERLLEQQQTSLGNAITEFQRAKNLLDSAVARHGPHSFQAKNAQKESTSREAALDRQRMQYEERVAQGMLGDATSIRFQKEAISKIILPGLQKAIEAKKTELEPLSPQIDDYNKKSEERREKIEKKKQILPNVPNIRAKREEIKKVLKGAAPMPDQQARDVEHEVERIQRSLSFSEKVIAHSPIATSRARSKSMTATRSFQH